MVHELRYDNTNSYLISCDEGYLMFDTGWAGTFQRMCGALGKLQIKLSEVKYLLISHFHPDHMGLAGEMMEQGATVLVLESQMSHMHDADSIFARDKRLTYIPIADERIQQLTFVESRVFLSGIGIAGCILSTPGHSDDSISLLLDSGDIFVGDLYPLYELEAHDEPDVQESWKRILDCKPSRVFYGHAKTAVLEKCSTKNKVGEDNLGQVTDQGDGNTQSEQGDGDECGMSVNPELHWLVKKNYGIY